MSKEDQSEQELIESLGLTGWREQVFYAICHLSNAQELAQSEGSELGTSLNDTKAILIPLLIHDNPLMVMEMPMRKNSNERH